MQANNSLEPFVIIFQGRCGSTYLVEALDKHPAIECADERLAAIKKQNCGADIQLEWAEDFLSQRHHSGTTQKGSKTKLRDVLDPADFSQLLQSLDCRIIHLRRNNVVKLTISNFNSVRINDKTGDWNLYNRTNPLSKTSIDLETFDS